MPKPELLPCPFCGGPAAVGPHIEPEWVTIECATAGCDARPVVDAPTLKQAKEKWNTRAENDTPEYPPRQPDSRGFLPEMGDDEPPCGPAKEATE